MTVGEDARWFVQREGRTFGPFSPEQMQRAVERRGIQADTPVRLGEQGDWFRASEIPGLLPAATADSGADDPPSPPATAPTGSGDPGVSGDAAVPPESGVLPTTHYEPSVVRRRMQRRRTPWPAIITAGGGLAALMGTVIWLAESDDEDAETPARTSVVEPEDDLSTSTSSDTTENKTRPAATGSTPTAGDGAPANTSDSKAAASEMNAESAGSGSMTDGQ